MNEFFHRQERLWQDFGKDPLQTQANLAYKSIAIIGAGGLGSSLAYALSASGIGKIYVVDFDKVSLHNIHRQIIFEKSDVGEDKASVFRKLKNRYEGVQILPYIGDSTSFFREQFSYDLILDGSDNLQARSDIRKAANERDIPWIYASVEGFHTQVAFIKGLDEDIFKDAPKPAGIAAPIVMLGAALSANLALRYLAGLSVEANSLYYLDLSQGVLKTKTLGLKS